MTTLFALFPNLSLAKNYFSFGATPINFSNEFLSQEKQLYQRFLLLCFSHREVKNETDDLWI